MPFANPATGNQPNRESRSASARDELDTFRVRLIREYVPIEKQGLAHEAFSTLGPGRGSGIFEKMFVIMDSYARVFVEAPKLWVEVLREMSARDDRSVSKLEEIAKLLVAVQKISRARTNVSVCDIALWFTVGFLTGVATMLLGILLLTRRL